MSLRRKIKNVGRWRPTESSDTYLLVWGPAGNVTAVIHWLVKQRSNIWVTAVQEGEEGGGVFAQLNTLSLTGCPGCTSRRTAGRVRLGHAAPAHVLLAL